MYFILFYDYVENITEKRAPYREKHLELIKAATERGEMQLAGAYANPTDGAAFVFKADDRPAVDAFVDNDPYVEAGLVTAWCIREWTVVAGAAF